MHLGTTRRPARGAPPPAAVRAFAPSAAPVGASSFAEQEAMAQRLRATALSQIHGATLARWTDYRALDPWAEPNATRRAELKAFAAVQAILHDADFVREQLRILLEVAAFQRKRVTDVIAERERHVGLLNAGAMMFGNVPAASFAETVAAGEVFDDMGAGSAHGRLSHRAQWYVVSLFVERDTMLTAYRASVDPYWMRPNPAPPPAKLAAWDHIVDVPFSDRATAGAMNPETVRNMLTDLGLPARESWDNAAKVPAEEPPKRKLPKRLRDADKDYLEASGNPTKFDNDAADAWMATHELDTMRIAYDGYEWSGWRLRAGTVAPTVARPLKAAPLRKAV